MTTPLWLFRSQCDYIPFVYSSSACSCHLFLISSVSVRSLLFLSSNFPLFTQSVPLLSPVFLKWSLVFPVLVFSFTSLHCSLKKALSLLAIVWNCAFSWLCLSFSPLLFASLLFLSYWGVKLPQTTILPSCLSFFADGFGHYFQYNDSNLHP